MEREKAAADKKVEELSKDLKRFENLTAAATWALFHDRTDDYDWFLHRYIQKYQCYDKNDKSIPDDVKNKSTHCIDFYPSL